MPVRIKSLEDCPIQQLPGRSLQWLVTRETIGAINLSIAIMTCPPHSVVRPMHSHEGVEEVLLILRGGGEAMVDGDVAPFAKGDAVLFPANSRHMVRNTRDETLTTASIFSPPTNPSRYRLYEGEGW